MAFTLSVDMRCSLWCSSGRNLPSILSAVMNQLTGRPKYCGPDTVRAFVCRSKYSSSITQAHARFVTCRLHIRRSPLGRDTQIIRAAYRMEAAVAAAVSVTQYCKQRARAHTHSVQIVLWYALFSTGVNLDHITMTAGHCDPAMIPINGPFTKQPRWVTESGQSNRINTYQASRDFSLIIG
jgi:hypothetical protein